VRYESASTRPRTVEEEQQRPSKPVTADQSSENETLDQILQQMQLKNQLHQFKHDHKVRQSQDQDQFQQMRNENINIVNFN
jgi:hypothetical protein